MLVRVIVWGSVAIAAVLLAVYLHGPWWGDVTPWTKNTDFEGKSDTEIDAWMNQRILDGYCETIKDAAERHRVPARLLATVLLTEIADYGPEDRWQEVVQSRTYTSGWPQLSVQRVARDLPVELTEEDEADEEAEEAAIWAMLVDREKSIDLAAMEVSRLLGLFAPGQPYLDNAWAKAFLKDPSRGIVRGDVYANLRLEGMPRDAWHRRLMQEETLALMILGAYNSGDQLYPDGQIWKEKESSKLGIGEGGELWRYPEKNYPMDKWVRDARRHAVSGKMTFCRILLELSECLKETRPPSPPSSDGGLGPADVFVAPGFEGSR